MEVPIDDVTFVWCLLAAPDTAATRAQPFSDGGGAKFKMYNWIRGSGHRPPSGF